MRTDPISGATMIRPTLRQIRWSMVEEEVEQRDLSRQVLQQLHATYSKRLDDQYYRYERRHGL